MDSSRSSEGRAVGNPIHESAQLSDRRESHANTDLSLALALRQRPTVCMCTGERRLPHEVHSASSCLGDHPNNDLKKKCTCDKEVQTLCRCPYMPSMILSYDCNCQYSVKLRERCTKHFPDIVPYVDKMRFTIPVVHLQGHKSDCEYWYSSYYMESAGHFYGEQCESTWAEFNQLGGRTRQMNTGMRHDCLNCHLAAWNWDKTTGSGA